VLRGGDQDCREQERRAAEKDIDQVAEQRLRDSLDPVFSTSPPMR
jgi:hypothetical protein